MISRKNIISINKIMIQQLIYKVTKFVTGNSRVPKSKGFAKMKEPIVTVKQGKLKGAVRNLLDGTPYYSFKGIPYAAPPKYRFEVCQPPKPWQGVYEAINHTPVCTQYNLFTREDIEGDEYSLHLNVYTKSLAQSSKLPVMVFIHGGAYMSMSGDSDILGPEFLIQHDVILVTINYRLEALGFLCLDTPEVPGNAGMKDQVYALRWVKNNIAQFGGDPDNITLFGESVGATSVTLHMQSPMSRGLFTKAIAQSGTALCDWAKSQDGRARAFRAGKYLGKDTEDTTELLEWLRSLPATKLTKLNFKSRTNDERNRGLPIHFAPIIEKNFDNVEAFLTDEPINLLLNRNMCKMPMILGYTSLEGLLMIEDNIRKLNLLNKNPQYLLPHEIGYKVSEEKARELGDRLKKFYIGDRDFKENDYKELLDMLSDNYFIYNIHRFAHYYSDIDKVFMYRFDLDTDLNFVAKMSGLPLKGTAHADDLFYLFHSPLTATAYDEQEKLREYVYKLTKLWTNFAKTGNPTPDDSLGMKWSPYNRVNKEYLDIKENMTVQQFADGERVQFWNKMYKEVGLPYISKSSL